MELKTLIAECTVYDFKLMLEEKKPKSLLKSVSALGNDTLKHMVCSIKLPINSYTLD